MSEPTLTFSLSGVRRGARIALPVLLGTAPFGVVVGITAESKGLSIVEAALMAALVFAGSAQLLALELWSDPAPILAATLAALMVNLRFAPMGAALAPWLDRLRGVRLWGTLATLVDQAFALSVAEMRRGGRDAGYLLGVGLALWAGWTIAVTLGHLFGAAVRLPPHHPVHFAAIATFIAIAVPLWQGWRQDLAAWTVAGITALAGWGAGLGPPWPLLIGALAGAAVGAWQEESRRQ